jgi:hypothetical protein
VHLRLPRRQHERDDRLVTVSDGEGGGRSQTVGESLQHGAGNLTQSRPHAGGELDQPGCEGEPAIVLAANQVMVDQRAEEAIDGGSVGRERAR